MSAPLLRRKIALLVPDLPTREELAPYLQRIDRAHWYTNFGPLVRELEASMGQRLSRAGTRQHVVTVANATLGLEVALLALQLPPGSRVLMPALTFVATATAAQRAGCVPVFCDVDPATWLMTPEIAEAAMKHVRVDAIMPVATYGCPCDSDAWDALAERTGMPIVIDAAGAYGNQACGRHLITVISLHATKSFSAAEGGLIVSANQAYAGRVRSLSNFGIDYEFITEATVGSSGLVQASGTNAKLSEYHAAIALAALERWPETSARRTALHLRYVERLAADCPSLCLQARREDGVYSILPALAPAGRSAARVWEGLRDRGIESRRWYCPPLPDHPAFNALPVAGGLDVTRVLGERLIALPFHLGLSGADISEVIGALADLVG